MTNNTLIGIYGFLGRIKLNLVTDKAVRNTLIGIHLKMHKMVKAFQEDETELRKRFLKGHEREVEDFNKALSSAKDRKEAEIILENCVAPEAKALVESLNEALANLYNSDCGEVFDKIEQEALLDICEEQGIDINCIDLINLEPILKTD